MELDLMPGEMMLEEDSKNTIIDSRIEESKSASSTSKAKGGSRKTTKPQKDATPTKDFRVPLSRRSLAALAAKNQ